MSVSDLPLRPLGFFRAIENRETTSGFASRLAWLNGRPLVTMLRDMRIPPRAVDRGDGDAIRDVAKLGGADGDALLRHTPRRVDGNDWTLAGEPILGRSLTRTFFRYCPRCIAEDLERFDGPIDTRPWLRLEWTLLWFRTCDVHGIELEVTEPQRIPFAPFDFIDTMRPLLSSVDTKVRRAGKAKSSPYQRWILCRLEGRRDDDNWLDEMSLQAATSFCEALGISALHDPKVRATTLGEMDRAAAADEGWHIASAGPDALRGLLERLNRSQDRTRGVWGPRDTYGYVYGLLQRTLDDPAYGAIRDVVRQFAIDTLPLEPGTDVLGEPVDRRRVHTIRSVAVESGAHARTVRRIFERRGLVGSRASGEKTDHRIAVPTEQVRALVVGLKDSVTLPEVTRMTGIPRLHVREMVARGWLPTQTGSRGVANAKHRVSKADVREITTRLFAGAVEVEHPSPRQVGVGEARTIAICSLSQILALVFEDRLSWKGRLAGRSDYRALLVDADEVFAKIPRGPARTEMTKKEVTDLITGMSPKAVQLFIDAGHLQTVMERDPVTALEMPAVTRESAERFKSRYVSLGELCRKTSLHHKKVRLLLRGLQIAEVFDWRTYRTFFYRRNDVERASEAEPSLWQHDRQAAIAKAKALR